jgi:hypothetical protein
VRALLSLESIIQASSTLALFECGRSCPSNCLLRASSTSALFECGPRSLELSSLGQQRLYIIRLRALVPRIILFGRAAPLRYSSVGFNPSNRIFQPSVLSFYSNTDHCPSNLYFVLSMLSNCPKYGSNTPIRMPYVKYEDKSIVGNTRWPGIHIKRALPRNFPYLRYEVLHQWTYQVSHTELGFDLVSPHAARVEVAPAHAGSSRGTRI